MYFLLITMFGLSMALATIVSTSASFATPKEDAVAAEIREAQRALMGARLAYAGHVAVAKTPPADSAAMFPAYGFKPVAYATGQAGYVRASTEFCFMPDQADTAGLAAAVEGTVGDATACSGKQEALGRRAVFVALDPLATAPSAAAANVVPPTSAVMAVAPTLPAIPDAIPADQAARLLALRDQVQARIAEKRHTGHGAEAGVVPPDAHTLEPTAIQAVSTAHPPHRGMAARFMENLSSRGLARS